MTQTFDRDFWQSVVDSGFALPAGYSAGMLAPHLIELLGSPDPFLRDEVAYLAFYHWMVKNPAEMSDDEVRATRDKLLENLQHDSGETGTGTTFMRSFSALILSLVVYRDLVNSFMDGLEIKRVLDAALDYLRTEQDWRGYVDGQGWVHAVAHTADLLKFLARSSKTGPRDHRAIIDTIYDVLTAPRTSFLTHDEDERLSLTVLDVLKRDLIDTASWLAWVQRFVDWYNANKSGAFSPDKHAPYINVKTFLRSVYLRVENAEEVPAAGVVFRAGLLQAARHFSA